MPTITMRLEIDAPGDYEPNDSPAEATNLGTIRGDYAFGDLSIDNYDSRTSGDWYVFNLPHTGLNANFAAIDFDDWWGDLDMKLYDSDLNLVDVSANDGDSEEISLDRLAAGIYYVQVYGYRGATNPDYTLTINAVPSSTAGLDRFEPNDIRSAAHELGNVSGMRSWGLNQSGNDRPLSIHANDQDWFRFETSASGMRGNSVSIAFNDDQGDLDLKLYDASGDWLATSAGVGDSEQVSLAGLPAGTYYIWVYGYGDATNPAYSLTIDAPGVHKFESNDTAATAHDLNTNAGNLQGPNTWGTPADTVPFLSVDHPGDDDWFRFTTVRTGGVGDLVRIDFLHNQGDLDLYLYRSGDTNTPIRSSNGVSDGEQISLEGLAAGTYYILVHGYRGATNPNYSLTIDAPENPTPDWAEPNGTAAAAYDLGTVEGLDAEQDPLSIDSANDVDWFRFTITLRRPGAALRRYHIQPCRRRPRLGTLQGRRQGQSVPPLHGRQQPTVDQPGHAARGDVLPAGLRLQPRHQPPLFPDDQRSGGVVARLPRAQ